MCPDITALWDVKCNFDTLRVTKLNSNNNKCFQTGFCYWMNFLFLFLSFSFHLSCFSTSRPVTSVGKYVLYSTPDLNNNRISFLTRRIAAFEVTLQFGTGWFRSKDTKLSSLRYTWWIWTVSDFFGFAYLFLSAAVFKQIEKSKCWTIFFWEPNTEILTKFIVFILYLYLFILSEYILENTTTRMTSIPKGHKFELVYGRWTEMIWVLMRHWFCNTVAVFLSWL